MIDPPENRALVSESDHYPPNYDGPKPADGFAEWDWLCNNQDADLPFTPKLWEALVALPSADFNRVHQFMDVQWLWKQAFPKGLTDA